MSVFIQKGGILSTIQDIGRIGFRRFGINPNGAMDVAAARLINILLGNSESAAVLEMNFPASVLKFETAAIIAVGGADFGARLDDEAVENWRPYLVRANQTLHFPCKNSGNLAYLAVKGGFILEKWLNSAATNLTAHFGGFEGRSLRANDRLHFNSRFQIPDRKFNFRISNALIPFASRMPTVRVVAGAEFERLTAISEQHFLTQNYTISQNSNRMGFRLNGEPLYLSDQIEMVSAAVNFGTIQLTPDGQMIILMADAQTSGGYPRIAHVISTDLPLLAQRGAGDKVNFELVSLAEAEDLTLKFQKDSALLKVGVESKKLKY